MRLIIVSLFKSLLFSPLRSAQTPDASGVPVFEVTPVHSTAKFSVKASVAIAGKFDKWDAKVAFQTPDVSTGSLESDIQADSVDTGSGRKKLFAPEPRKAHLGGGGGPV